MSSKYIFRGKSMNSPTTASSIRRDKTTRKINEYINSGITSGPGISVTPKKKLIKKEEIPSQYHRILQESAGHCRSHKESACVRKLLEAVRFSIDEDQHQILNTLQKPISTPSNLDTYIELRIVGSESIQLSSTGDLSLSNEPTTTQIAALERLYTDSPRGLAAPSCDDKDDDGDNDDESLKELPSQALFDSPQKTVVSDAPSFQDSDQLEEVTAVSSDSSLQPVTGKFAAMLRKEIASAGNNEDLASPSSNAVTKENDNMLRDGQSSPTPVDPVPVRPPHPLFAPHAFALSRTKLKKVSFGEIQDSSGPRLKTSLTTSTDEFPEEVLVAQLRGKLDAWLSQEVKYLPLDASKYKQHDEKSSEATLGVGRFAKVIIGMIPPNEKFVGISDHRCIEPVRVALKISTFVNHSNSAEFVPRGVLLSWEREMKSLIALSKLSFSDHLVQIKGGCLNPKPMIALELCNHGNLTQLMMNENQTYQDKAFQSNVLTNRTTPSFRMNLILDCCLGLSVMHKAGWCHLDLKPHNVMISNCTTQKRLIAKIGDFGSCFEFTTLQRSYSEAIEKKQIEESAWSLLRAGVGTTGWTAPDLLAAVDVANEIHEGGISNPVDDSSLSALHSSSDCFSFGILIWFCLYQDIVQFLTPSSSLGSSSPFSTAMLLSANPLIGLDANKCKVALLASETPPWPNQDAHQDDSVFKVGSLFHQCLALDKNCRPDMDTINRDLRAVKADSRGRWSI